MQIPFTKMHGLGNDFIVIDGVSQSVHIDPDRIKTLADRRFGIGFDQLLLVEPPSSPEADFDYRIFNVDGSEVEHCGNGARCFATFVREKGLSAKNPVAVRTLNRILILESDHTGNVTVDMGAPELNPEKIPFSTSMQDTTYRRDIEVSGESMAIEFSVISMGNPHAVIIVEDLANTAVKDIGGALGSHPDFPEGVNVGFMQIDSPEQIKLRVFERGVGETLACGTGACAAIVAGQRLGLLNTQVNVRLAGGSLSIEWPGNESSVLMSGPTATVYEGTLEI